MTVIFFQIVLIKIYNKALINKMETMNHKIRQPNINEIRYLDSHNKWDLIRFLCVYYMKIQKTSN